MGVCIPMSIKSLQKRKTPKGVAIVGIFRRAMTLFLLGFFANTLGKVFKNSFVKNQSYEIKSPSLDHFVV